MPVFITQSKLSKELFSYDKDPGVLGILFCILSFIGQVKIRLAIQP